MTKPKSLIRSVDATLRAAGFRIYSRPAAGPTLWARRGATLTQRQALNVARMEAERKKAMLDRELERVNE